MSAAIPGSSNDSWAITWHQWQAAYPIESRIGLSSARAFANAASPHANQSTGLSACWRRYGLVSCASRFIPSRYWRHEPSQRNRVHRHRGLDAASAGARGRLRRRRVGAPERSFAGGDGGSGREETRNVAWDLVQLVLLAAAIAAIVLLVKLAL